ncbi:MAG: Siroheme synthase / Precorrin-2 oxidase [Polyangiaceae bacterium]|jgi:siroheme synthase-like protein|nr:Siroheme synthase / Precorrin-2 oxidase [Polyangiaceae bacterium]
MTPHGYPLNLLLDDRKCVVVGGGAEAALRTGNLLEAGARVLLVGEEPTPGLELLTSPRLSIEARAVEEKDLDDAWLVVQASQDAALAGRIGAWCEARRIFFCAVDQPEHSTYAHLALARAGSLTLAIGTEGRAPALGRRLREEFSRVLTESGAADEVERLAALRAQTPVSERRQVLGRAVADVSFVGSLRFRKE